MAPWSKGPRPCFSRGGATPQSQRRNSGRSRCGGRCSWRLPQMQTINRLGCNRRAFPFLTRPRGPRLRAAGASGQPLPSSLTSSHPFIYICIKHQFSLFPQSPLTPDTRQCLRQPETTHWLQHGHETKHTTADPGIRSLSPMRPCFRQER